MNETRKTPLKSNLGGVSHINLLKNGNFIGEDYLIKVSYQNDE